MRVLVHDDVVLECTVPARVGVVPQEHPHAPRLTAKKRPLSGTSTRSPLENTAYSGGVAKSAAQIPQGQHTISQPPVPLHLTIIKPSSVLHGYGDPVVARATLAEVVVLEVKARLGETVDVRYVVHGVHEVERVRARSVDIHFRGRRLRRVLCKEEFEPGGRLGGRVRLRALECDDVVAAAPRDQYVSEEGRQKGAYAVAVVVVVPSLCQPSGDAAGFCGSVRTSKPSVKISLVIGSTRYCDLKSQTPPAQT